MYDNVKLNP